MKKYGKELAVFVLIFAVLAGCSINKQKGNEEFDFSNNIVPINRERGSGTRISFLDFLNLEEEGLKEENETIVSDTEVVLSAVESDFYAIGYLSGSKAGQTVKAVSINGIMPSGETIIDGTYPLSRTFYLVSKAETNELTQDFLNFVQNSTKIIEACGYIPVKEAQAYASEKPEGELKISGSSSVYPLIEELAAQYETENPNAEIEINKTDSSNGIKNVEQDIAHIAMSSLELTEEELAGKTQVPVAKDGIAVIVNIHNPIKDMTMEQLRNIYTGSLSVWKEAK